MREVNGRPGVEEGKGGIAGIDAEFESGFQSSGEAGRIEDGLPQSLEGYVDWSDIQEAGYVSRGISGVGRERKRKTCEDQAVQLRVDRACGDVDWIVNIGEDTRGGKTYCVPRGSRGC